MRVVICHLGKVEHVLDLQWRATEWNVELKKLYLKYQRQEVYVQYKDQSGWLAIKYTFVVTRSGMHPSTVDWNTKLTNAQMPRDVQMKMLMVAL